MKKEREEGREGARLIGILAVKFLTKQKKMLPPIQTNSVSFSLSRPGTFFSFFGSLPLFCTAFGFKIVFRCNG